jgi:hypothetical protein
MSGHALGAELVVLQSEAGCKFVERNANPVMHRGSADDRQAWL